MPGIKRPGRGIRPHHTEAQPPTMQHIHLTSVLVLTFMVGMCLALPRPQQSVGQPQPEERQGGGYGKQPDGYFQYVNVPAHKEYEFGWNRGNPHHYISRYEQSKDHRFRTRVRWGDQKGGYGEHYYEYNHGPPKYEHKDHHEPSYAPPPPPPPKYPSGI